MRYVVSEAPPDWSHDIGRLDDEFLAKHLDAADKAAMYFVCGNARLIDDVIKSLDELDLATPGMVHSEDFSIYD